MHAESGHVPTATTRPRASVVTPSASPLMVGTVTRPSPANERSRSPADASAVDPAAKQHRAHNPPHNDTVKPRLLIARSLPDRTAARIVARIAKLSSP